MVTGVPSSGMEYEDFSSPGFTPSAVDVRSVGVVLVSVSVGAGSGRDFLSDTPIVNLVRLLSGGVWALSPRTTAAIRIGCRETPVEEEGVG
jgi:hypothetical protein